MVPEAARVLAAEIDQLRGDAGDLSRRIAAATARAGGGPATSSALLAAAAVYFSLLVTARVFVFPGGFCSTSRGMQTAVFSSLAMMLYVLLDARLARSKRLRLLERRSALAARVRDLWSRIIVPGAVVPDYLLVRCDELLDYVAFPVMDEPWWSEQSINNMQALLLDYSGFQFFHYSRC